MMCESPKAEYKAIKFGLFYVCLMSIGKRRWVLTNCDGAPYLYDSPQQLFETIESNLSKL
jgi:hypothetical protein